jgi:carbonic anhydrase
MNIPVMSLLLLGGIALAADPAPAADHAAAHAQHAQGPAAVDTLVRLSAGNARFAYGKRTRSAKPDADPARRAEIAGGQHPVAAVMTCADSRVPPELLFDQGLGDLFVVRNAGNVAEPIGLGSLEYGVEHLGIRLVVVLGHSSCGAVKAVSGAAATLPGHLADIQERMPGLRALAQERARAGDAPDKVIAAAVERNAEDQARALLAGSPVLKTAVAGGVLVVPAVYDLESGLVTFLPAIDAAAKPAAEGANPAPAAHGPTPAPAPAPAKPPVPAKAPAPAHGH